MGALNAIRGIIAGVSERLGVARRSEEFMCGDCEIVEHCSRPPSETCTHRAAHIARDDWRARRWAKSQVGLGAPPMGPGL